jgi:hypothetical protein
MKLFRWREINQIPTSGGVYAWYFTPDLSEYDSDEFIRKILLLKENNDVEELMKYVDEFLYEYIFRFFVEKPYEARVYGALKPNYQGVLHHKPAISSSLVQRLIEKPGRIKEIGKILSSSVPNFSSPIYIGMSKDLSSRLAKHKSLIEKYRETPSLVPNIDAMLEEDQRDHSFAKEVCARSISPTLLSVIIEPVMGVADEWIDVENILNRIHFPLLGRN